MEGGEGEERRGRRGGEGRVGEEEGGREREGRWGHMMGGEALFLQDSIIKVFKEVMHGTSHAQQTQSTQTARLQHVYPVYPRHRQVTATSTHDTVSPAQGHDALCPILPTQQVPSASPAQNIK